MENTGKSIGSSILIVSVLIRTPFCWIILRSSPLVMCFPGCSMLIGRAGRRLLNHWIAFITDPCRFEESGAEGEDGDQFHQRAVDVSCDGQHCIVLLRGSAIRCEAGEPRASELERAKRVEASARGKLAAAANKLTRRLFMFVTDLALYPGPRRGRGRVSSVFPSSYRLDDSAA